MMSSSHHRLGIDLGGTKIEVIALHHSGEERFRKRVQTPQGDYEKTLLAMEGLVREAEAALGETGCPLGVGTPGSISAVTGNIKNSNSTCLIGKPLKKDLERLLNREVRLQNDANCFALSEAVDGAAAGMYVVFGVILGTGVGGGIVIDGRALEGANAIAGEWGHNPLPWPTIQELPGPQCYCGKHGCIETFLSGPALERDKDLVNYCDRLARGLASVINVLDPDAIVLGGGVSNRSVLYDALPELLQKYVFSDRVETKILKARFGDSSGVRGAAWLWPVDRNKPQKSL